MANTKIHVAIISSPGMGHLIPAILLSNRLITDHNVHVTILVISSHTSPAESEILLTLAGSDNLTIIKIPSPDIRDLIEPDTAVVTQICVMMREVRAAIRSVIADMSISSRPHVLICDLFSTESWTIAEEFGMAKYAYVTCSAWFVALTSYCHVLDGVVEGQYVDQKEPLQIPGCKAIRPEDVVDPMLDRNNQQYREYVRIGIDWTRFDGLLINTWQDHEPKSIHALRDGPLRSVITAPIYPIGPLSRPFKPASSKTELVDWLDSQPAESVLFVSFGSGGTMSAEQMTELAWGLEMSQQRFVWVVRPPSDSADSAADAATFFSPGSGSNAFSSFLPDEFLRRTHKVGLVVPQWGPQVEILNHPSVGGFLSHSGMNSTYESICSGVPMIVWPLYAEQRLNATMLIEEAKVAMRPEIWPTKKVVRRNEIEKLVRRLMESEEGKGMRERVKKLKESGEKALGQGGTSYNSLCQVVQEWHEKVEYHKVNGKAKSKRHFIAIPLIILFAFSVAVSVWYA